MGDGPDNGVSSPEDKGVCHDGVVELGNVGALCSGEFAAAGDKLPDDHKIGNASECVPPPGLKASVTESSKQTGQDHDDVGSDCGEDASTIETREETEVEDEQRSGQSPVDIASIVNGAVDVTEGVRNMIVMLTNPGMVPGDAAVSGHGKVRKSSDDGDQSCDVVVETLGSRDRPRQDDEEQGGNDHENEDDPERTIRWIRQSRKGARVYHSVRWPALPALSMIEGSGIMVGKAVSAGCLGRVAVCQMASAGESIMMVDAEEVRRMQVKR